MKNLKVMQVLPDLNSGGVERGTFEIATYLKKHKVENIVCSNGGLLVPQLKEQGIQHVKLSVHSKNILIILKNVFHLAKLIRAHNISVIHARSRAPAWSCYLACKFMRTKFVTTFHAAYSASHPLKRFYNSVMLKGDRVIAISNYIKKHIETRYRFTENKLVVIDRGVDLGYFNPSKIEESQIKKIRSNLALPVGDEKLIILPARFTRLKGHLYLLKALKYLSFKNYKCLMIGKADDAQSSYLNEIDQMIKANKLENKVIVVKEPIDDMAALYSIADVVISSSLEPEGFGRTIIEAQAMKSIIISTNIGAPFDLISHGKTGFVVPTSDPATFAETIDYALNLKPLEKKKITAQAMSSVKSNYSLEVMCKKTLNVYQELLDQDG